MTTSAWTWAELDGVQLEMIVEAERTLGNNVKYILAYRPGRDAGIMGYPQNGMQVSNLNGSQIECLQGLEKKLQTVMIAYR